MRTITTTTSSIMSTTRLLLSLLVLFLCIHTSHAKIRIYILLGQSNMEGAASTDHFRELVESRIDYRFFRDNQGNFQTRSDVRLMDSTDRFRAADLEVGYLRDDAEMFGPEIGFGWHMGTYQEDPILLVKCTGGGTHLGVEWRSPSGKKVIYTTGDGPFPDELYSTLWNLSLDMVKDATSNLGSYMPGFGDTSDYEISGIIWFQGWNDAFRDALKADYEENLIGFINDLQTEFGSDVPIIVGELGQEGVEMRNPWGSPEVIRQSQERAVAHFNSETVVFVPTSVYVRDQEEHFDGIHHYYGRADTIIDIGYAFGREMIRQLTPPATASPTTSPPTPSPSPQPTTSAPTAQPTTTAPSSQPTPQPVVGPVATTPPLAAPTPFPVNIGPVAIRPLTVVPTPFPVNVGPVAIGPLTVVPTPFPVNVGPVAIGPPPVVPTPFPVIGPVAVNLPPSFLPPQPAVTQQPLATIAPIIITDTSPKSNSPSLLSSGSPSMVPSATPSAQPSLVPSATPSAQPSATPSAEPSMVPSATPSLQPIFEFPVADTNPRTTDIPLSCTGIRVACMESEECCSNRCELSSQTGLRTCWRQPPPKDTLKYAAGGD